MKFLKNIHKPQFNSLSFFTVIKLMIVFLAVGLRLYKLDSIPSILNPDEASIAYNAYLLLNTGKDETGSSWPIVLEAFGDQKIFGYTILVVLSFLIFGLSDMMVRLPAAIAGILIVIITDKILKKINMPAAIRLAALLIISIQPVFIWYSRAAFEAAVSLVFVLILWQLLFIEKSDQYQLKDYLLITLSVLAAAFTYNTPLIIIPLFALFLPLWHGLKKLSHWLPAALTIVFVWAISLAVQLSLAGQKTQITIFGDPTIRNFYGQYRASFSGLLQTVLGNQYVFYLKIMAENFLQQFNPGFLLNNSPGHPWHALSGFGYITWPILILGWLGIAINLYKAYQHKKTSYNQYLLLIFFTLTSIIPSAITVNAPHATRTLLFFWGWSVMAAQAVYWLSRLFKRYYQPLFLVIIVLILIPSCQYVYQLFWVYPDDINMQSRLQSGYDQVLESVEAKHPEKTVAVEDGRGFHYILTAWYTRMSSDEFFSTLVKQQPDTINFRYGERVGRYQFITNRQDRTDEQILIYWDVPSSQWIVVE